MTFADDIQSQLQPMRKDAQAMAAMRSMIALEEVRLPQGPGKSGWTSVDFQKAMLDVADLCEKCHFNFIVLGDLARAMKDNRAEGFNGEKIEIGMFKSQLVPEVKSLFKTWGFKSTVRGYLYYFTPPIKWDIRIPIHIKVIRNSYSFFSNPDIGWFGVDDYKIPNPFEEYWKMRNKIK